MGLRGELQDIFTFTLTTSAVTFRKTVSANYSHLIKIVGAVFKKIAILFLGPM
jgi:hypothetical protein